MAAEHHVRRSLEALAARLRDDISRHLDAVGGELATSIDEEHARAAAAADEERATAFARAAEEHEAALERARRDVREEAERVAAEHLAARVADAESRGREAGREDGRREWDTGRAEALELARAEREASDLAASVRLVDAIRAIDRAASLSEVLDTLASAAGRDAPRVALLLVQGGRLHAWRFIGFGAPLDDTLGFDVPLADGGIAADAVGRGGVVSAESGSGTPAPPFAPLSAGRQMVALPVPIKGEIVAVLYADQGEEPGASRVAWGAGLEIITRHAARSLEAITAFRAAQVFTARPHAPATPAPHGRVADRSEDEQSARRYARLLISEIKLYHEPEVIAGRRERDLAERLGGEITRARVLYERRVPAHIRTGGDYFGEELVRTLADGDAELMTRSSNLNPNPEPGTPNPEPGTRNPEPGTRKPGKDEVRSGN